MHVGLFPSINPGVTHPTCYVFLRYMKGRVSYDQLNTAVHSINTAVAAKYKILRQPMKALNNHARKLHQRFKDQETKDTKGIMKQLH